MSLTRWWSTSASLVFAISLGSCIDEDLSSKADPPVGVVEMACEGDPGPGDDGPGRPDDGNPGDHRPGRDTPCRNDCVAAETACQGGADERRDACVDDCPTREENEACKAECLVNCKQGKATERAACRKACAVACPESAVRQCPRTCRRTWREEVKVCDEAEDICIDECKAPLQSCLAQRSSCFDAARTAFDVCEGVCADLDAHGQGSEPCLHACFTAQRHARRDCREEMRACIEDLDANQGPIGFLNTAPELVPVGAQVIHTVRLTVSGEVTLTLTATSRPPASTTAPTLDGMELRWIPEPSDVGVHTFTLTASQGTPPGQQTGEQHFTLTVVAPTVQAAAPIGEGGGVVSVSSTTDGIGGLSLTIPEGATGADGLVKIEVATIDQPLAPPALASDSSGTPFLFAPEGTRFTTPIDVSVPWPARLDPLAESLTVFMLDGATGRWDQVPVYRRDLGNRLLFVEIDHFSALLAGAPAFEPQVVVSDAAADPCLRPVGLSASLPLGSTALISQGAIANLAGPWAASSLRDLAFAPSYEGTLRFIWILDSVNPTDPSAVRESAAYAASLFVSGAGPGGKLTLSTPSGELLMSITIADFTDPTLGWDNLIEPVLTGHAFQHRLAPALDHRARARVFVRHEPGDATALAFSPAAQLSLLGDRLGPTTAALFASEPDLDCDRIADAFDPSIGLPRPTLALAPAEELVMLAGNTATLSCTVSEPRLGETYAFTWTSTGGDPSEVLADPPAANPGAGTATFGTTLTGFRLVTCATTHDGLPLTGTFRVLVNPPPATNLPPTCTPQAATSTVRELETLSLTAATRDPDGDPTLPLPVRWTLSSEIVANGPSYAFAPALSGAFAIGCQAADAVGWGPITTTTIEVVPAALDLPPRNLLLNPRSLVIRTDEQPVHFTANVTDDSPQLTWVWSSTSPIGTVSTPIGMGTSSTAILFGLPVGSYMVSVEVSDGVIGHMPLSTVTTLLVVDESAAGVDLDGDGYRTEGLPFDCDDSAPAIHPAAAEICGNGRDDDCDGLQDEGFPPGCGYAVGDRDNDLVGDDVDNCPDHANPDQRDADFDGIGDACDLDLTCPGPCDDANPCTDDTCDPLNGVCRFVPNTNPCEDGDPCTLGGTCAFGTCVATPLVCPPLTECVGGLCVPTCIANCLGRECGDDGCGGICGMCPGGTSCDPFGHCTPTCTPSCGGRECGDDGCGGSCGLCGAGRFCGAAGECLPIGYNDSCEELYLCMMNAPTMVEQTRCYADSSAQAQAGYESLMICAYGACAVFPEGSDDWRRCKDESVAPGGACWPEMQACMVHSSCLTNSDCGAGLVCQAGQCVPPCVPECTGRVCGGDGCGGSCGGCPAGESCDATGLCTQGGQIETCADLSACLGAHQTDPDYCRQLALPHVLGQYDQMVQCVAMQCPAFDQACIQWALAEPCRTEAEQCFGPVGCNSDSDCGAGLVCRSGQCVPPCVPECAGRECGGDGCGGSCGGCPAGESCDATGQCTQGGQIETCADLSACLGTHQTDPDYCRQLALPHVLGQYDQMVQCVAMQCPPFDQACIQWALAEPCRTEAERCFGPVGCNSDSDCGAGLVCQAGQCVPPCVPECTGRECGGDGCGGSCGGCPAGESCDAAGRCAQGVEIETCADLNACFGTHQNDPDFCLQLAPPHVIDQYNQLVQCVEMHCPAFDQPCVQWAVTEPCRAEAERCSGPVACTSHADCGGPPCIDGTCQPGQCNAPCDSGLLGPCAAGTWRCDTSATCQATSLPGLEACDDNYDNDCDGEVDELECQYGLGVSCDDPQPIQAGATLVTTFAGHGPTTPTDCGPSDADRVFRFSVPTGGADLVLDVSRSSGVTYRLVSGDCQTGPGLCIGGACCNSACQCAAGETCNADGTCSPLGSDPCVGVVCPGGMICDRGVCLPGGEPPPPSVDCHCTTVYTATLPEGDYHLVASHAASTGPAANARIDLRLALSVGGVCLTSDLDGDGFTVCDGDCDESRADTYPGALERCDGLDNDCDAMADEGDEPCTIAGALGPCAIGALSCATVPPGADPLCEPTWSPRTDWCDDGIDGDCDGAADALDPEGCVTRLSGDTCDDPIELGLGGHFEHDFAGLLPDLSESQCTPDPRSTADLVYRVTIHTPSMVRMDPTRSVGVTFGLFEHECGLHPSDCSAPCDGQSPCWPIGERWVMPGTYYLVAWASPDAPDPHVDFTFVWRDMSTLQCSVPDMDGDGFTLCDGDCDDDDFGIAPGVPELCDGLDNDCDRQVDEGGGACATGLPGPCGLGWLACAGTSEVCSPLYAATTDWCGDGVDSNCSGDETDCEVPPATLGESCLAPRVLALGTTLTGDLSAATDDLGGACQPFDSPEHVFAIEVPMLATSAWVDLTGSTGVVVELRLDQCEHGMMWACAGPNLCPGGQCYMRVDVPGFAARAWLVVEPLGGVSPSEAHYQLRLVAESNGQCLLPDGDTDGFTTCTDDCDDTNPDVFPGAAELCNGTDDDCDGATDELQGDCVVPGAHGPCAFGRRACLGAAEVCEQVVEPRAEFCATGIDEDCDGTVDEDTVENTCTELPPGETCGNPTDLGAGGHFVADFVGRTAELTNECSPEPIGADLVYRLTVVEPSRLVLDTSASVGVTFGLYRETCGGAVEACSAPCDGQTDCWHWPVYQLPPGTYYLVAMASSWSPNPSVNFTAALIGMSGECSVPDMDGDGFTLCNGDCDDEDFGRAPNAPEVCDGVDNDCDHQVDEGGGACTTSASGPCAFGRLTCVGASASCVPLTDATGIDWCGDTWDDDCSGDWADCATPTPPLGEACNAPQPLPPGLRVVGDFALATDDLPPVMGSFTPDAPERVIAVDIPPVPGARVRVDFSGSHGVFGEVRVFDCEGGPAYRDLGFIDCSAGCADAIVDIPPHFGDRVYLVLEPRHPDVVDGTPTYVMRALVDVDGQCLNPDGDVDGHTLCDLDCNDADPDVHPNAAELCNLRDDDCDGAVDEGGGACTVPGQQGICATGQRACVAGAEVCEQATWPRPERCDNQLDDDCDGLVDGLDDGGCSPVVVGDSCADPIELGAGGRFIADLAYYGVELAPFTCAMPGPATADAVAHVTVPGSPCLEVRVTPSSPSPNLSWSLHEDFCGQGMCVPPSSWFPVRSGNIYIAVESTGDPTVAVASAFVAVRDRCTVGCLTSPTAENPAPCD